MNRIKQLRMDKKIRQADLAKYLNVSQGTLSNWERGIHDVDNDIIVRLSDFFGVTTDYLLKKTDNNILKKDQVDDANYIGQEIYNKLVEIGAIALGEIPTKKQIDALFVYFKNNSDYIKYVFDKNK